MFAGLVLVEARWGRNLGVRLALNSLFMLFTSLCPFHVYFIHTYFRALS